jgi:hypothetical protein
LQFFPTTGRDEFYGDNDQLYHDGIELDRANDWQKTEDIAMAHRSIFSPGYDETRIKKNLPLKRLKTHSKTRRIKQVLNIGRDEKV